MKRKFSFSFFIPIYQIWPKRFRTVNEVNDLIYVPIKRLSESMCSLYYLQKLILYCCDSLVELPTMTYMAGAVAGGGALLSASLKVLLNRMDSPEVRTFLRGQKLSATLRRELKMKLLAVKAVLNDAEAKQITNSDVKDWMDELKDAITDLPDSIGNLTHLRYLDLTYTPIKRLPESVCNLYNLQTLILYYCELKEMPSQMGGEFPRLKELYIKNCPKLTGDLPNHLPLLTKLEIEECEQLVAPLPRVPAIRVLTTRSCDISQWKELPPLLRSLSITNSDSAESLLEEGMLQSNACLEDLSIINCGTCNSLSFNIPHGKFPRLARIQIWGLEGLESLSISISGGDLTTFASLNIGRCPNLVSIELPALNISRYSIFNCENLKSLLHNAACFQSLVLEDCPELIFPIQGLPSNLTSLFIRNCDKLTSQVEWGLQGLPSLTSLTISGLPNLMSLDGMGLQLLTSLRKLQICDGPKLQSLTEERLPSSLSFLTIRDCPLLKDRCKFWTGEDWHLIAHIPHIVIDDQVL
ncbi:unnamed protein product, partial [Vitis vinifera]